MTDICLLDTSILLNILNVPSKNEAHSKIVTDLEAYIELGCEFIIPFVVAVEVGNHISQNGDGNTRRKVAQAFVEISNNEKLNPCHIFWCLKIINDCGMLINQHKF